MSRRQQFKEQALVKLLRYMLGVAPAEFALVPDDEGWVKIKELMWALHEQEGWRGVREGMVRDAASRLAPELLEIQANLIRCREPLYPPPDYSAPVPAHLYVGLRPRAYPVVRERGLEADEMGRARLLAADPERALAIARRRDPKPVLATIQTHKAQARGAVFAAWGEQGLFLADWLPPEAIMGPEPEKVAPAPKPRKPAPTPEVLVPSMPENLPGSFTLEPEHVDKPYRLKGLKKDIPWKRARRRRRR